MDIDAHISLGRDGRLSGMDPHPNVHRACRHCPLRRVRGGDRVMSSRERDEERVALRVYFDAVVFHHRVAKRASMLGEDLHVAVAELVEEPSRTFDVGEEKRHGA